MRNSSSNVMPFEQNAEFFFRRAQKKRQGGHYPEAVSLLLRAVQADPSSSEPLMELAELYSEMGCPLESNRCLIVLLSRPQADVTCWFGLACNLYAMGNTAGSQLAALNYLNQAPEGAYHEEASHLISALQYAEHMIEPADRRLLRCHRLNNRAAALLNADQACMALPLIEKSLSVHDVPATQALYAFALSEAGETERALCEAGTLLHRRGLSNADCLYALRILAQNDQRERALEVARVLEERSLDAYERRQLFDALLLLNPEDTETRLKEELDASPFDRRLWHVRAALDYNAGRTDEALSQWRNMLSLNPQDALSALYVEALTGGHAPSVPIPLNAVLAPELKRQAEEAIRRDEATLAQLTWAIFEGSSCAQRAVRQLERLDHAELAMRVALAEPSVPSPIKHALADALKKRGIADPYLLIDRTTLSLSAASTPPAPNAVYAQRVLRDLVPLATQIDERLIPRLVHLWEADSARLPRHEKALYALGAALICQAARELDIDDPTPLLLKRLKISGRTLAYYTALWEKLTRKDVSHDAD